MVGRSLKDLTSRTLKGTAESNGQDNGHPNGHWGNREVVQVDIGTYIGY